MTITVLTLLKRRPGMTKADFIAYYEAHHRLIGEQVLSGHATRYIRRFLHPLDGTDDIHDPDVVMDIDFPNAAARDACFAAMADAKTMAMIVADEAALFDRPRIRSFAVEEHASHLLG